MGISLDACFRHKYKLNLLAIFCLILNRNTTDVIKKSYFLVKKLEEKIKIKLKCLYFLLVGDNFISLEDFSNKEYTEGGLTFHACVCSTSTEHLRNNNNFYFLFRPLKINVLF